VVISVEPARAVEFEGLMAESAIPWRWIGATGGERVQVRCGPRTVIDAAVEGLRHAWRRGFERHVA
jgi:hypothetical protein